MTPSRSLAEIVEEGERLETEYARAVRNELDSIAHVLWDQRSLFWDDNGPRLLAVARAAVKMRAFLNTGHAYEGECPDAVEPRSLDPTNCRCCAAIVAFDAAVRGDEGEG